MIRRYFIVLTLIYSLLAPLHARAELFNFIVSDSDMNNESDMDEETLRRFLLERGTLGKISLVDSDGVLKPAHRIIKRVSRSYNLNPKFLLVLLQREQSLVDDPTPSQNQLDWAVGYGVCDSCDKNDPRLAPYKGFANQLENAARRIRELVNLGIGFQPGQNIVIDGIPVTPENRATAALYTYTPHLHGNNNFRDIWRRYFLMRYPDGTLLQPFGASDVYLIQFGRKRAFASLAALSSRYNAKNIVRVLPSELDAYETGPLIAFPNYSLLHAPNDGIYLLADEVLRPIDRETFRYLGFDPDELIEISDVDLVSYQIGKSLDPAHPNLNDELLQAPSGGVFALIDGVKRPIVAPEVLRDRYGSTKPRQASKFELDKIPQGEALLFRNGSLVKSRTAPDVYLISNGVRRPFLSARAFLDYGFEFRDVISTTKAAIELHPLGNAIDVPSSPTFMASM